MSGLDKAKADRDYYPMPLDQAVQEAREMVDEWDYYADPHGYCHVRPMLVALVEAAGPMVNGRRLTVVLAPNYPVASHWAREHVPDWRSWRYVSQDRQLLTLHGRGLQVVLIGDWWRGWPRGDHEAAAQRLAMLEGQGAEMETVP